MEDARQPLTASAFPTAPREAPTAAAPAPAPATAAPAAAAAAAAGGSVELRAVPFHANASLADFFSTLDINRFFSTSFAFCFSMREGMLILAGFQLVAAIFWLSATSRRALGFDANWPAVPAEEGMCIALLLCNVALTGYTVKRKSEMGVTQDIMGVTTS